ncbi:MAG TPA: hypothetical protein VKB70_06640 [Gaiellaceae bacterium]|nr:hypothetical protein [Gaiellaceae bacterium]
MPPTPKDREALVQWRRLELLRCGFAPELAARIAEDERFDLHDLIELVEQGSSPALAVRILSPLEAESLEAQQ